MMFKEYFRARRLRKDASRVKTAIFPLGKIRHAAVVLDGAAKRADKCAEALVKFCAKNRISLSLLYVDLRKFNSKLHLLTDPQKTVLRRDLNWFGRPRRQKADKIVSTPVDLYICLYDSDIYCIKYFSSSAKARFKIGLREYPGDPYNFVVSPGEGGGSEMDAEAVFLKIKDLLGKVH